MDDRVAKPGPARWAPIRKFRTSTQARWAGVLTEITDYLDSGFYARIDCGGWVNEAVVKLGAVACIPTERRFAAYLVFHCPKPFDNPPGTASAARNPVQVHRANRFLLFSAALATPRCASGGA